MRGNISKKRLISFAFEKTPPHQPHLQASSSPLPRIRIWPIDMKTALELMKFTCQRSLIQVNI